MPELAPSPFPEAVFDRDGIITVANDAYAALFGFRNAAECAGNPAPGKWLFESDSVRDALRKLAHDLIEDGRAYAMNATFRRADGVETPMTFRAMNWVAEGDARPMARLTLLPFGCEIPPHAQWEAESIRTTAAHIEESIAANRARARQAALAELGLQALRDVPLPALMQLAIAAVREHLRVPMVKILEHDAKTATLVLRAAVGFDDPALLEEVVSVNLDTQAGFTWAAGAAVTVADIRDERRFSATPLLTKSKVLSGITVPILGRGQSWGVLGAHDVVARTYSTNDADVIQSAANIVGERIARHAAEAERDLLARIVEEAPLLVGRFSPSRKLLYLNTAARSAFGFGPDADIHNVSVNRLLQPFSLERDIAAVEAEMARGSTSTCDSTCTPQRGEPFIATVSAQAQLGADGTITSFAFFALDITERMRSRRALEASLAEVQRLAQHLDTSREEQAQHCAMELHDDLGQTFSAPRLAVAAIERAPPGQGGERVRRALGVLEEALASLRRITSEMRPMLHEGSTVAQAFATLCATHGERTGTRVDFVPEGELNGIAPAVAISLYRIAQEALSNATRHGKALRLECRIAATTDGLDLRIKDQGVGFDTTGPRSSGLGLIGMRERALAWGGTFRIESASGAGTVVHAHIPQRSVTG